MLSVVVPVYNERDNIRTLLERTVKALRELDEPAEVLVVDDDSPDGTAREADAAAVALGAAEMVRTIVRTADRGLANAVMEGFRQARGDVLAVMDADLSHPPELLGKLLAPIRAGTADIAVASRRCPGGGVSNWPIKRRIISWGAGLLARPLVPVKDTTSGYFAVRASAIAGVELRPVGYKIGLEVFARATERRMVEVPFVFTDRVAGTSKLAGSVMLAYLVQLAGLYLARFPRLVGFVQFGLVGSLGIIVDAAIFSLVYYYAGLVKLGAGTGSFLAQTVSFGAAAVFNFVLNRAWTFKERSSGARAGIFLLVSAGGYVLRSPVIYGLVVAGVPPIAALMAGIVLASAWNYLASRRWAFPESAGPRPDEDGEARVDSGEVRARNLALALIFAIAFARFFYAGAIDLSGDEAYYWQWSRHLDWGYLDHPPMVAYLIAAGTERLGDTEAGVRLLTVVLSSATLFIVYRLGRRWAGNARAGLWAVATFAATPLFAVEFLEASPDVPFLFFWAASISHTLKALRSRRMADWVLLGIVLGFGMLSKYLMLVMPVAILAALLATRERRVLATSGPYVAALACALICAPLVAWQLDRGFEPVLVTLARSLDPIAGAPGASAGAASGLTAFSVTQLTRATPLVLALGLWALLRWLGGAFRGSESARAGPGLMKTDAALPMLVFPAVAALALLVTTAALGLPDVNAPGLVLLSACALLGSDLARWTAGGGRARAALAWGAVALALAVSAYLLCEPFAPAARYPRGFIGRTRGHEDLGRWVSGVRDALGADAAESRLLADDCRVASLLAFYVHGRPETDVVPEARGGSQYACWRQPHEARPDAPVLFVSAHPDAHAPASVLAEPVLVGIAPESASVWGAPCRAFYGRARGRN